MVRFAALLRRADMTSRERSDAREVESIFMKEWNFIGRADYIPNPGDYFTLEFVGVPVIVVV